MILYIVAEYADIGDAIAVASVIAVVLLLCLIINILAYIHVYREEKK